LSDGRPTDRWHAPAAAALIVAFLAAYLPDVGHGFVKDDFSWIVRSSAASWSDFAAFFRSAPQDFFRPIVSVSFAIDRWLAGLHPWPYGLTNLALAAGCAAGVAAMGRSLGLSRGASLAASALWAFNWHGINMAVVWISGRTELMVVLFSALAAAAFLRNRPLLVGLLVLLAMLSKEEALLLPLVFTSWYVVERWVERHRTPVQGGVVSLAASGAALAVALILRFQSGAMTPSSAPSYYRLDISLSRLAANLLPYLDRSATASAAIVIGFIALARALPRRTAVDWRAVRFGATWWIGTFAITIFLPTRSSLYACLPACGVALIAGAVTSAVWPIASGRIQRAAVVLGCALPFLLWPVYRARNTESVREADLTDGVLVMIRQAAVGGTGDSTAILLRDRRTRAPSLDNAFGTLVQPAVDLTISPAVRVWIAPRPAYADAAGIGFPPPDAIQLMVTNDRPVLSR